MGVIAADKSSIKGKSVICEVREPLIATRDEEKGCSGGEFVELDGASFGGAVFNLSTTIVGAGIMALPATMKVLGLVPGVLMILFVALLTEASIDMLIRSSRAGKLVTYGGVVGDAFGDLGRILLQSCVVVNNVGVLIVYMIIIGDVLSGTSSSNDHHSGILEGWFGSHWWSGRFFVLLITTLGVFAPLTCFKRVDSLSYTSALSVALAVLFVVITAGIAIVKLVGGSVQMPMLFPEVTSMNSVWNLFTVVPVVVTAYICHYNVHTIDNELDDSTQIKPIVRTSLGLCSTVYVATSFFGFLLFGNGTLDDVLANFDSDLGIAYGSFLNDLVRVSYVVHLMLVFPIVFFALRLNVDGLLFPTARPISMDNRRFALVTASLIAIIFSGANFIPSIWDAFQFTGATAAVAIGFIFPAAVTLRDMYGIATSWDKILSVFMIVLAVASNAIAIYSDAYSIFHKGGSSPRA
ncbi:amino acid transporter AVT6A-like [Wolffia australiana]